MLYRVSLSLGVFLLRVPPSRRPLRRDPISLVSKKFEREIAGGRHGHFNALPSKRVRPPRRRTPPRAGPRRAAIYGGTYILWEIFMEILICFLCYDETAML